LPCYNHAICNGDVSIPRGILKHNICRFLSDWRTGFMPEQKKKDKDFSLHKKKKKKRSKLKTFFSTLLLLMVLVAAGIAVFLVFFLKDITQTLPSTEEILAHEPSLATTIYDRNDNLLTRLFEEDRTWVKLENISPWMVKAVLAAEDGDFYEHSGIKITSIVRAGLVDLTHRGARQGGSTITQQLARNLFLTKEKTISRKAKEAILAMRLEKIYSKDQILEMYLNTIYMGHGTYGIDSASKMYFGKAPINLDIAESAILAGLIAAPETFTPYRNQERSQSRKEYVLRRMLDLNWISNADYESSVAEQPPLQERTPRSSSIFLKDAPHFVSHILFRHLLPTYGAEQVYRGGLRIYTTVDADLQKKAEELLSKMKHEGALVALDPNTGEILALVGGRDFDNSKFNRATQAFRQPGSAFKPVVYATAIEQGYRPVDHLLDAPLHFPNGWQPGNYSKEFAGEVTLVEALARSLNTVSIRLAQIDGVGRIINLARRIGITTQYLPEDLSIALGTPSVTPLEMSVAYSTFANNGYRVEPYGIKVVRSKTGAFLEQNGPKIDPAIAPTVAVTMRSMLMQVASWGTGARARMKDYETFGKTGTTNDWTDAWFVGGIPGLVVVVYIGNDDHSPLGGKQTGTLAALPVWKEFMDYAVTKLNLPKTFTIPSDASVESIRICRHTGFLAASGCTAANILVPVGQAPVSECPWYGGSLTVAQSDGNAPQLLLAPIDDEMTRMEYALSPLHPVDDPMFQPDDGLIVTHKREETEPAKVPQNASDPYKGVTESKDDYESRFQDLLKQYNIKVD